MIILKESTLDQTLNIIPRKAVTNLEFTDEQTNEVYDVNILGVGVRVNMGYYTAITTDFPFLKENHTYSLEAYSESFIFPNYIKTTQYKDLVFCTNEDVDLRVVEPLDDLYTQNNTDSDYITYED